MHATTPCDDKICIDLRCRIPIPCFNLATYNDHWSSYMKYIILIHITLWENIQSNKKSTYKYLF